MKLFSFILMIFFLPLITANGLEIVSDTTFDINKTVGIYEYISIQIKNADSFSFYNVSLDSPYAEMSRINEILPGEIINASIKITSDETIYDTLRFFGYYESAIGSSNLTHYIDIDYSIGITPCILTIVKGDYVVWNNYVNDDISLWNIDTNMQHKLINKNTSSTLEQFLEQRTFNYNVRRHSFIFSENCRLSVLNDYGLVTNPEYDTSAYLNIIVDYVPTIMETTFIETSYSMNFYSMMDGLFLLKNNGNNSAKNINLIGDWFSFSDNNFDIEPGYSKTISYTINPDISQTIATNKTYNKTISIHGNFNKIEQNIDIYINYADIDSGNYSEYTSLEQMLIQFCENNPDICNTAPQIIYRDLNNSDYTFNETWSQGQIKEMRAYQFEVNDKMEAFFTYISENLDILFILNNQTNFKQENLSAEFNEITQNQDNSDSFIIVILAIIFVTAIAFIVIYLGLKKRKQNKIKKLRLGLYGRR